MPNCGASQLLLPLLLCLCLLHSTRAYFRFRQQIPNGDKVPNPCEEGAVWDGVGHENPRGAGARNPFGRDFAAAGHRWTEQLCRRDSDGDGRSNGEELGDPDCVWREGGTPSRTSGISHPGVCPLDSTVCSNDWDVCPKKFDCPSFRQEGVYVRNFTLKESKVPPQETTYMCQAFELNATASASHMIGSIPILKNKNVIHHMIIYACTQKPPDDLFDNPRNCFMGNHGCIEFLSFWTYGMEGECFNEKAGVLVGGEGYQYGLLELHWNNPEKLSTYTDSSGLSIYFTDELREHNQGSMNYGELSLVLPPKQPLVSFNHTCPAKCTRAYLSETRYITSAMIHMHNFGVKGRSTLWRDGRLLRELVPMHDYDYDTPMLLYFDPPVEFRRGDEVKTECYFSTVDSNHSIFWGFDTNQEMCFVILNYYPNDVSKASREKLSTCYALGGINECMLPLPGPHVEAECNVTALRSGEAARRALAAMNNNSCFWLGCQLPCRNFLNNSFWPQNACFDPRRSKSMAEIVSTQKFLAIGSNDEEKQRVMQDTELALSRQRHCERELQILADAAAAGSSTLAPTQAPTSNPKRRGCCGGLGRKQLFVVILVCCCLAFATAMLGLLILGVRLWTRDRRGFGNVVCSGSFASVQK